MLLDVAASYDSQIKTCGNVIIFVTLNQGFQVQFNAWRRWSKNDKNPNFPPPAKEMKRSPPPPPPKKMSKSWTVQGVTTQMKVFNEYFPMVVFM